MLSIYFRMRNGSCYKADAAAFRAIGTVCVTPVTYQICGVIAALPDVCGLKTAQSGTYHRGVHTTPQLPVPVRQPGFPGYLRDTMRLTGYYHYVTHLDLMCLSRLLRQV